MKIKKLLITATAAATLSTGIVAAQQSSAAHAINAPIQFRIWTYTGMSDGRVLELSARSILGNLLFAAPFGALLAFLAGNAINLMIYYRILPPLPVPDTSH
ncbi:MAG: hypothetical protein Q3962_04825 [Corynebacterium sp.]|nr:hypothetical protein [Corynebacterium sp.]